MRAARTIGWPLAGEKRFCSGTGARTEGGECSVCCACSMSTPRIFQKIPGGLARISAATAARSTRRVSVCRKLTIAAWRYWAIWRDWRPDKSGRSGRFSDPKRPPAHPSVPAIRFMLVGPKEHTITPAFLEYVFASDSQRSVPVRLVGSPRPKGSLSGRGFP